MLSCSLPCWKSSGNFMKCVWPCQLAAVVFMLKWHIQLVHTWDWTCETAITFMWRTECVRRLYVRVCVCWLLLWYLCWMCVLVVTRVSIQFTSRHLHHSCRLARIYLHLCVCHSFIVKWTWIIRFTFYVNVPKNFGLKAALILKWSLSDILNIAQVLVNGNNSHTHTLSLSLTHTHT